MLLGSSKYLNHFLLKSIVGLALLLHISTSSYSQNKLLSKDSSLHPGFNPIFISAYKNPYTLIIPYAGPSYKVYLKKAPTGLMYWPNYPLTSAQIEARNREWDRRNKQTFGGQIASDIASDIIKNQVNSLIYGKKMPVAVTPKF